MLKVWKILVIAHALVGGAAMLAGCGHKGALTLPTSPESQGRATLPQTLNPWHKASPSVTPAAPTGAASEPAR
jgi:predicted small lipoprotein YifL